MSSLLIRNLSPKTIAALDASAEAQGLSREEYVRRRLDMWANQQATAEEIAGSLAALDELDAIAASIDVLQLPPIDSTNIMQDERS